MKNNKINPIGLKGNEINERMRELMGIKPINENKSTSVVELSKIGPDGKSYAIVRENHEYFIKVSEKTSNLLSEDFKYIGGLQNKKSEAYPSYAKAIKHLNLNFKSLAEAYGKGGDINVFKNDNLITESGVAGFSQYGGNGFSNEGNMEHNTPMFEGKDENKNNPWAICTASVGREDKEKYEACVMGVKKEKGIEESMTEEGYMEECGYMNEDVAMTEVEEAIDRMLEEEDELVGNQGKLDVDHDGDIEADDLADLRASKKVDEHHLSIARAMENLDAIIEGLSVKKKVQ
jgi:hypothetical protein